MLTPEHLQLLSNRRLTEAVAHPERVSETDEQTTGDGLARMARFELRRRQCQVPVRHRYASVALRSQAQDAR